MLWRYSSLPAKCTGAFYFAVSPWALAGGCSPDDSTLCVSVVVVEPPGVVTVVFRSVFFLFFTSNGDDADKAQGQAKDKKSFRN